MERDERSEQQNAVEELVLRGKALDEHCESKGNGVLIHVLWGKYVKERGAIYEGFGLQMEDCKGLVKRIPDLSTDAWEVCQLAERMNRYQVSRHHFDDVVADFLAAV